MNELWSLDIHTYEWTKINTTVWKNTPPPPREQHVAAVIGTNIYIFGGKTRLFPKNADGTPLLQQRSDHVFNDVWKLNVQPIIPFNIATSFPGTHFAPLNYTALLYIYCVLPCQCPAYIACLVLFVVSSYYLLYFSIL